MLQLPEQWGWIRVFTLGCLREGHLRSCSAPFADSGVHLMLRTLFPPINNGLGAELQPLHSPGIPAGNAEGVLQAHGEGSDQTNSVRLFPASPVCVCREELDS